QMAQPALSYTPGADKDKKFKTQYNRYSHSGSGPLTVRFLKTITTTDTQTNGDKTHTEDESKVALDILRKGSDYSLLACSNLVLLPTPEFGMLTAPVFYQDDLHTF